MGGDQLVGSLIGEDADAEHGEGIRSDEKDRYAELIGEVAPLDGARELLAELKRRGHSLVLASSAKPDEVDHYLDLLDARGLADGWTTAGDVERTKPEPDVVLAALEKAGDDSAVMVGTRPGTVRLRNAPESRRSAFSRAASAARSSPRPARRPCSSRLQSLAAGSTTLRYADFRWAGCPPEVDTHHQERLGTRADPG